MSRAYLQKISLLSLIGVCLTGCLEDVSSTDVPTELTFATLKVEGRSNGTSKVTAEFNSNRSNGDNIILEGGDFATASANTEIKRLVYDNEFFDIDYQGFFNTNAGGTEFVIALTRPSAGTSAPNSRVRLPEPYLFRTPVSGQSFNKSSLVYVSWTNAVSSNDIEISHRVKCAAIVNNPETESSSISDSNQVTVTDTGSYTIVLSQLTVFSRERIDLSKPCELFINLNRENRGQLDPNYEGGIIKANQVRNIDGISVNPNL